MNLKRIINMPGNAKMYSGLLIVIFILLLTDSKAQDRKFSLGVKGGPNVSTYLGDLHGSNAVISYHVGIYSRFYKSNSTEYWQMEVLYSEKGSRYDDYIVDVKQTLTYIDVPVLYHFVKETGNGFIIGPQVSVFLDSENEMLYQKGHAYIHMMEIHDNNAFRPIDIGIVGGFIFSIEDLIRIEGRMGLGLTNFVNNSVLDREEKLKGRIANVQLSVGLNY